MWSYQTREVPLWSMWTGIGPSSIFFTSCHRWRHNRCSKLRILKEDANYVCPTWLRQNFSGKDNENDNIKIEWTSIDEVKEFRYLSDLLDYEVGVERSVRMRVAAAWRKWREISSLLINKDIPLRHRGQIFEACVQLVLFMAPKTCQWLKDS